MALVAGIDISKDEIVGQIMDGENPVRRFQRGNHAKGVREAMDIIPRDALIALEPTNRYHELLVVAALDEGRRVAMVRGVDVKHFALSRRRRVKNDRLDAKYIALYASLNPLRELKPEDADKTRLRYLLRRRDSLMKHLASLKQSGVPAEGLASLVAQKKLWEKQIREIAKEHPLYNRLLETPGFGPISSAAMVQLLWDVADFPTKQHVTSFAGLDIVITQSGKSNKKSWISKQGDPLYRKLLYLAGMAIARAKKGVMHEKLEYYRNRPFNPLAAHASLCALARKLLHTAWSMARSKEPFDPVRFVTRLQQPKNTPLRA